MLGTCIFRPITGPSSPSAASVVERDLNLVVEPVVISAHERVTLPGGATKASERGRLRGRGQSRNSDRGRLTAPVWVYQHATRQRRREADAGQAGERRQVDFASCVNEGGGVPKRVATLFVETRRGG